MIKIKYFLSTFILLGCFMFNQNCKAQEIIVSIDGTSINIQEANKGEVTDILFSGDFRGLLLKNSFKVIKEIEKSGIPLVIKCGECSVYSEIKDLSSELYYLCNLAHEKIERIKCAEQVNESDYKDCKKIPEISERLFGLLAQRIFS